MKRSLGAGEWIRRGLGVAVAGRCRRDRLGLDTGLLTRVSLASTAGVEQTLLDKVGMAEVGDSRRRGHDCPLRARCPPWQAPSSGSTRRR